MTEAAALLRAPQRAIPLVTKIASDKWRTTFEPRHLYSYASTIIPTECALRLLIDWILNAQRPDGGVAAYYSLLTGYSDSYPEVTGYIIPTLYDFSTTTGDPVPREAAERATHWLLSLQLPSGAFPAGLHAPTSDPQPSAFNTGQILQGLVRAHRETRSETEKAEILERAQRAGTWLAQIQQPEGSWIGPAAYQGSAHTYYSMVSWALAQLAAESNDPRHAAAADRNIDWVLGQARPTGWIDGINLEGHPTYLHFIAYVIQGILECGILRHREDAIQVAKKSAWVLLRKFETHKRLLGTYEPDFTRGQKFSCLTGNAQMSCVWLRLGEVTGDLRYLNYMDKEWWETSASLYDPVEHLYFRDSRYFTQKQDNGQKVFWARGNGWVMGSFVKVLEKMPKDYPSRAKYIAQYKEMAERIAAIQGKDGLWRSGLLDPGAYDLPEVSGSAFFTYAMAWGINHGILDAKTYKPVVTKAWAGMLKHVYADGRLGDIQQTGAEPAAFKPSASYTYGVGGFLLALG